MSALSDVQRIEFETMVKHAYQGAGSMLENTVRVKNAVRAGEYRFRKFGELNMVPRGQSKSMLEGQEPNHSTVTVTASDYVLPVLTDIFDQAKTDAPDEQAEAAQAIAMAMKRQRDYSVISALDSATIASGNTITCGSGLTVAKLREGMIQFDKYEIRQNDPLGDGTIYMLITEVQHDELLADAATQSIDTSDFKSLVNGKVGDFMGYKFILIGSGRGSLGLPEESSGVRACWAYTKSAIGQAVSIEPRVESSYENLYTSHLVNGILSLGTGVIDNLGVVQFNCTE